VFDMRLIMGSIFVKLLVPLNACALIVKGESDSALFLVGI